ncbi:MAG: hypothetical protein IRY99_08875 [Isosphaeraceae bacterium]|nr:hypothetical protein [Isosphaeraceae bacterium]
MILEQATQSKFENLEGRVEVCDESGRLLDYFFPVSRTDREEYEWAKAPINEEDLERIKQEPGGYTMAEVLEYLSGL